jgi:hypothetical protein
MVKETDERSFDEGQRNEVDSRIERQSRQRPDGQTPAKETAQAGQPQNPIGLL